MSVLLYSGQDLYFRDQAVAGLRQTLVSPYMASLSHKKLVSPGVLEAAEAIGSVGMSLFGGLMGEGGSGELIEIHQFGPLHQAAKETPSGGGKGASKNQDSALDQLKSQLAGLAPHKTVLFVADKIDRKVAFAKWLTSQAFCKHQTFEPLPFYKVDEAASQLVGEVHKLGLVLNHDAAEALVASYGTTFYPLINEVRKLGAYATNQDGKPRPITKADVEALCHNAEGLFALMDDLVKGHNPAQVFHSLEELLLKDPPVRLYAAIQSYLMTQHKMKIWQTQGITPQSMAERLGKHPYKVGLDLKNLSSVRLERLSALCAKALAMEAAMKSGQLPDTLSLELLMAS
jgi:DNA polymerase-3 subunit delta